MQTDYLREFQNQLRPEAVVIKQASLSFPDIIAGVAGEFASEYASIMEPPIHFFFTDYLACLGAYLSGHITVNTVLNVQPRVYAIKLGPSGTARKSTPQTITTNFFRDTLEDFSLMTNVNSGEGLINNLEKHPNTLLVYDEFRSFVSKATQKNSTLLEIVATLFERNQFQIATKDKNLSLENGHLSLLAACTTETFERCWDNDFTAIGLNNRFFLIPGNMEKFIALPPKLDLEVWKRLRDNLRYTIKRAIQQREYSLTHEANEIYKNWYDTKFDHSSLYSVRLDTYALKFMLLFAINEWKDVIDTPIVEKSIKLMEWQFAVRKRLSPIDADNIVAKIEERTRRVLATGPLKRRELQRAVNYTQHGIWAWDSAIANLQKNNEISFVPATKTYVLSESS